ncbi:GpE family phage tail protein [Limnobaculum zhutongyuii]|nr:GpE family phage tail protein [Limnobaculum zhutongyuii]
MTASELLSWREQAAVRSGNTS